MAVPSFDKLKLPILEIFASKDKYTKKEIKLLISEKLNLTDAEREELTAGGSLTQISDRTNWCVAHLFEASLLQRLERGVYQITEQGLEVLQSKPEVIDEKFLLQFPSFVDFINRCRKRKVTKNIEINNISKPDSLTPSENFQKAFEEIQSSLSQDILDEIKGCSARFFEKLVLDLLLAMGYGSNASNSGELTSYTNDEGIDGIIKEDALGLDKIYIQAKRYQASNKISRKEIQAFVGALAGKRAKKGVFITTSSFTDNAKNYVKQDLGLDTKVVLIDGLELASLMIEYNIGVYTKKEEIYHLKRIDSDYFNEEEI